MNNGGKCCHYFNNEKHCPYENIGCMFLHQDSENCYFGIRCKNKLCQFKHIKKKKNEQKNTLEVGLEDQFNNSLDDIENSITFNVFFFFETFPNHV